MISDDTHFSCKTVVPEFQNPCSIPKASLSILLYCFSTFNRLLVANTMGLSVPFPGITYNSLASRLLMMPLFLSIVYATD